MPKISRKAVLAEYCRDCGAGPGRACRTTRKPKPKVSPELAWEMRKVVRTHRERYERAAAYAGVSTSPIGGVP